MRKNFIRHDNLRRCLDELADDNFSDENIDLLANELKHSCLIVAGDVEATTVSLCILEVEGDTFGLLFTDMDEFRKVFAGNEFGSQEHDFHYYKRVIDEAALDGFIINPESEAFIFRKELFSALKNLPEHDYPTDDVYTSDQLRDLRDNIDNRELEEFISDPSNVGLYERLFDLMSRSTLLTLMLSPEDLTGLASDGIVCMAETGPLGFLYLDDSAGRYAAVFTSEDKILNVECELNRYSQIVNFSQMTNFALNDDLDGIIINPNTDNILLTRSVLFEFSPLLEKTCNDSRLNTAIMHLFIMEEA